MTPSCQTSDTMPEYAGSAAPGDVIQLLDPLEEMAPGAYVVLVVEGARAMLAVAGEDDAGDLVPTEQTYTVNAYHLSTRFKRTPARAHLGPVAP